MRQKDKSDPRSQSSISSDAYVRETEAPYLPPPPSEVGIKGWLYNNIFQSMSDFSSPAASMRSLLVAMFTVFVFYFFATQLYGLADFALFSAVWSDTDGVKRQACWTVEQGGSLPEGWHGACWPYIFAKTKFILFGAYPLEDLWRVKTTYLVGSLLLVWVLIEPLPYRKLASLLLLVVFPMFATLMLTGGGFGYSQTTVGIYTLLGLALITLRRLGIAGKLAGVFSDLASVSGIAGWTLIFIAAFMAIVGHDFGLTNIDTRDWGGLLITLVVAITAIVASLPLGILLALGRRSQMPIARTLSIVFIEFWRGVPLITVLFMASVMIPLFMPEGVNFDSLLRALIGVTLWQSAYMAEVIRGGLQAIDKGQYEAADAMGLTYWQSMRLVILPQALKHVLPGIVNTVISVFKDTSLVSIVGIFDLLGATQSTLADAAWSSPVQSPTGYLVVASVFFFFCFGMSRYSIYLEKKLDRGH
ncbi:MAG: amino acid ABC transporter permease [Candidatus Puniceispirillaceae bacterium]